MTTSNFLHDGHRLVYTRSGQGSPVLFLHNGGTTKEIWTRQVADLQDRYEVICLDHLGFGESDMPDSGYRIDDYVEALSAFIDHLGVGRVSVVGNCMGSAMALLLADRRPEVFDAVIAINPLTERTARRGVLGLLVPVAVHLPRLSRAVTRRLWVPTWLTRLVPVLQYGPRGWRRGTLTQFPGAQAAGAIWNTPGRLHSMAELFGDIAGLGEVDRLEPGPDFPPLAVVWGSANLGLSPRAGRKLNRTLRPARAEFLPRCGHLPMMENPEAVSAIIDEFITALPRVQKGAGVELIEGGIK